MTLKPFPSDRPRALASAGLGLVVHAPILGIGLDRRDTSWRSETVDCHHGVLSAYLLKMNKSSGWYKMAAAGAG